MPEIDGDRQHTMRAVPIGACETAPDVGTGALCRRREELVVENSVFWLKAGPKPFPSKRRSGLPGFFLGGSGYTLPVTRKLVGL